MSNHEDYDENTGIGIGLEEDTQEESEHQMPKFTPGPWEVGKCGMLPTTIKGPYVDIYAKGYISKVQPALVAGRNVDEAQANARLIAKAPEMYEILHDAMIIREKGDNLAMNMLLNKIDTLLSEIDGGE